MSERRQDPCPGGTTPPGRRAQAERQAELAELTYPFVDARREVLAVLADAATVTRDIPSRNIVSYLWTLFPRLEAAAHRHRRLEIAHWRVRTFLAHWHTAPALDSDRYIDYVRDVEALIADFPRLRQTIISPPERSSITQSKARPPDAR